MSDEINVLQHYHSMQGNLLIIGKKATSISGSTKTQFLDNKANNTKTISRSSDV